MSSRIWTEWSAQKTRRHKMLVDELEELFNVQNNFKALKSATQMIAAYPAWGGDADTTRVDASTPRWVIDKSWKLCQRESAGNAVKIIMFSKNDLNLLHNLMSDYIVLVANGHDIHLYSRMTGHEWIVLSPYDGSACEILHRHSNKYPFHHQRGQYTSIVFAFDFIRKHDAWYYNRKERHKASL